MASTNNGSVNAEGGSDAGHRVRLRLLGAVELEGPIPLRFLPERRFRLLAYLALQKEWVARDQLAHLFWPDRTQEAARSNLRKLLLEVRALKVPQLESDRRGVRWTVHTDVAEYKSALAAGDHAAALVHYHGRLLHGIDGGDSEVFSSWLQSERERLCRAWRDAALARLPHLAPANARELAQQLLDDDPFDEDAVVALIAASRAMGDGARAARTYRTYAEHLIESLGVEPSARVRAVAAAAKVNSSADRPTVVAGPIAQPVSVGDFIGRARELQEIATLLSQPDCRLLTVTGPGGMGKSRLVKHVVREVAERYADGVSWVALDDLTDMSQVAPRIAAELKVALSARQDSLECIGQAIADRHMLLVLDNSEHLLELSQLVTALLDSTLRLQVLATSRTRIGTSCEWLLPLGGLDFNPSGSSETREELSDAARLFVAQARLVHPRFDAGDNRPAVNELVVTVGGMPLAILLAASWVRLLPVAELAAAVTCSLDVLEREDEGDERPEHRSVRTTFEQSWRLLTPAEQHALAALSVTTGGFTRAAAAEIARAPLPLLAALHDKALMQTDGNGRFSLHPLIHQFAAQKLGADGFVTRDEVRAAHARYYVRQLSEYADQRHSDDAAALHYVAGELGNLRTAWRHCVAEADLESIAVSARPLALFFSFHGGVAEGLGLMEMADAVLRGRPASAKALAQLALGRSWLMYRIGRFDDARQAGLDGAGFAEECGELRCAASCENSLGVIEWGGLGRYDRAAAHFERSLVLARRVGDDKLICILLGNLGLVARALGDLRGAIVRYEEAATGYRRLGNLVGVSQQLACLGKAYLSLGEPSRALSVLHEALDVIERSGDLTDRTFCLVSLGEAYLAQNDLVQAEAYTQRALKSLDEGGELLHRPSILSIVAMISMARGDLNAAERSIVLASWASRDVSHVSARLDVLFAWGKLAARRGDHSAAVRTLSVLAHAPALERCSIGEIEALLQHLAEEMGASDYRAAVAAARALTVDDEINSIQPSSAAT